MKRIFFVFSALIVLCLSIFSQNNNYNVYAASYRAMCVIESDGTVLYEHNKDAGIAMASTTKIITAIVAIENCDDLDKVVTVADEAVGIEGTSIYLRKNEEITIKNLLYGLILASGNDASVALAYAIAGSEVEFVNLMNNLVEKLKLTNTQFKNPHGLDEDGHYTSAYDLAIITAYALNNDVFLEIVSTKTKILNEGEQNVRYLKNKNKLLFTTDNCIGVKTGFTDNAGRCLVNASEQDGMRVISVVLNCGPMFEECNRLTNMAFNAYEKITFVEPYSFVGNINVSDGDRAEVAVATIEGFVKVIKKEEAECYSTEYNLSELVNAPVLKDDKVGDVTVYYNEQVIYKQDLFATTEVKNINIKHKIDSIIDKWFS